MEKRATVESLRGIENFLTQRRGCKLVHNGALPFEQHGTSQQSRSYVHLWQVFPENAGWADTRANIRIHFNECVGVGTVKVTAQGMELLPKDVRRAIEQMATEVVFVPREYMDCWHIPQTNLTEFEAARLGALNLTVGELVPT